MRPRRITCKVVVNRVSCMPTWRNLFLARDAAGSRSGLRERSPAPAVRPDKAPPAKPKQTFPLQTGLWVLIIFTVCAGAPQFSL
eukprot:g31667.t1